MKSHLLLLCFLILSLIPLSVFSQFYYTPSHSAYPGVYGAPNWTGSKGTITLNSGDIKNLWKLKTLNIIYDYSEVGVDAYRGEKDFLANKKDELKDQPGKFEKFNTDWIDSRKKYLEPSFEESFNELAKREGMTATNYTTDNSVTLKVSAIHIVTRPTGELPYIPAMITLECTFMDQNGKELLRYFIKNVVGQTGLTYNSKPEELGSTYSRASKLLMKDIKKRLKKYRDEE